MSLLEKGQLQIKVIHFFTFPLETEIPIKHLSILIQSFLHFPVTFYLLEL